MIMDLNVNPSPFPIVPSKYDDRELHPFVPNYQASSSSSSFSPSCVFFHTIQDQTGRYQPQLCPLQHHQDRSYAYTGGLSTTYEVKWKKEDPGDVPPEIKWKNDADRPVKLMSSKIRKMQKMKKNHDGLGLNLTSYCKTKRSYSGTDSSNNIPIRVCSDCNTTKTPLWRSGPKGPKSLCNACGIKQRKARRAAMAATAANGAVVAADKPRVLVKIKMQHREKETGNNPQASLIMKRSKKSAANITAGSKSNGQKKLGTLEDLLMKLSKNLAFHRVFPEDEKVAAILLSVFPEDEKVAAILLMALSYGLLHG